MSLFIHLLFFSCVCLSFTIILFTPFLFTLTSLFGCSIILLWFSWQITLSLDRHILPNASLDPIGKAIFITGCDYGFGYETSIELQRKGWRVFATVLNEKSESAGQ